jgi:hypothetical protein
MILKLIKWILKQHFLIVKLLRIYMSNTLTVLANLERSTASLKVFMALSSHLIYGIKLFITSL